MGMVGVNGAKTMFHVIRPYFLFQKQPDYSYYAFAVLQVEKVYEENIGIWKSMCSKMAAKPKLLTEMAHKVSR